MREEDRDLFKAVKTLIDTRNGVASHRGEVPSETLARECVQAAFDAFRWLDVADFGLW